MGKVTRSLPMEEWKRRCLEEIDRLGEAFPAQLDELVLGMPAVWSLSSAPLRELEREGVLVRERRRSRVYYRRKA